jgi:hypothetical protein
MVGRGRRFESVRVLCKCPAKRGRRRAPRAATGDRQVTLQWRLTAAFSQSCPWLKRRCDSFRRSLGEAFREREWTTQPAKPVRFLADCTASLLAGPIPQSGTTRSRAACPRSRRSGSRAVSERRLERRAPARERWRGSGGFARKRKRTRWLPRDERDRDARLQALAKTPAPSHLPGRCHGGVSASRRRWRSSRACSGSRRSQPEPASRARSRDTCSLRGQLQKGRPSRMRATTA